MRHRPNRRLLKLRRRAEFLNLVNLAKVGDIEHFRQNPKEDWIWYVYCQESMRGIKL